MNKSAMSKAKEKKPKILVYGVEQVNLEAPEANIETKLCVLHFEPLWTSERFQDYDGVILFQGIFEDLVPLTARYPVKYEIKCEGDELQRRKKQCELLKEKKGFICFLLSSPFVDRDEEGDKSDTDLAKWALNYVDFYRENMTEQETTLRSVMNEFIEFIKHYGAAHTIFMSYNDTLEIKEICKYGDNATGIVLWNREYFIPTLLPAGYQTEDYFKVLADALLCSHKRLSKEIPGWVDAYRFEEEKQLIEKSHKFQEKIERMEQKLLQLKEYKGCICYSGELLRESVIKIFRDGFGFNVDESDEFREDLKIIDNKNNPVVLLEVKGTNKGITRQDVNQADSHRERDGVDEGFPSVLIVNMNIKKSNSLQDKYRQVAKEQIKHTVKMNILIMRAIDLLNMLYFKEKGTLKQEKFLNILKKEIGWLETSRRSWKLRKR